MSNNASVFKRQCNIAAYCATYSQWFEDITPNTKNTYLTNDMRQRLHNYPNFFSSFSFFPSSSTSSYYYYYNKAIIYGTLQLKVLKHSLLHLIILHSFNKYLLSIYSLPGHKYTVVKKITSSLSFSENF